MQLYDEVMPAVPTAPAPHAAPADPIDDGLAADAVAFHAALAELVRAYQFRDRDRICCHDLSVSAYYALDALVAHGPISLRELAERLYLDKSSASRLVAGIERKGYVARNVNRDDGRAVLLRVSPTGLALYDQITAEIVAEQQALLAPFGPQVRQAMAELLQAVAAAPVARTGSSPGACCAPAASPQPAGPADRR